MRLLTTLNDPSRQLSIVNLMNTLVAAALEEGATEEEVMALAEAAMKNVKEGKADIQWHDLGELGEPELDRRPATIEDLRSNLSQTHNLVLRRSCRFHPGIVPWPAREVPHFRSIDEQLSNVVIAMDQVGGTCASVCVAKGVGKHLGAVGAHDLLPPLALHVIASRADNIKAALRKACYVQEVVDVVRELLPGVVDITRIDKLSVPRDPRSHERMDKGFAKILDPVETAAFIKVLLAPALGSGRLPKVAMVEVRGFTGEFYQELKAPGSAGGPAGWSKAWFPSDPKSRGELKERITNRRSCPTLDAYGGHVVLLVGIFGTNDDSWVIVEDHHGSQEGKNLYAMPLDDVVLRCTDFWLIRPGEGLEGETLLRDVLSMAAPEALRRKRRFVPRSQSSEGPTSPTFTSSTSHCEPRHERFSRKRRSQHEGESSKRRKEEARPRVGRVEVENGNERHVSVEEHGEPSGERKWAELEKSLSDDTLAVWKAEAFCLSHASPSLPRGAIPSGNRHLRMRDILTYLRMEKGDATEVDCKVEQEKEHHMYYIGALLYRLERDIMDGVGVDEVVRYVSMEAKDAARAAGIKARSYVEAHGLMQALKKHKTELQTWLNFFCNIDVNHIEKQRKSFDYYRRASSFPAVRLIAQPTSPEEKTDLASGSMGLPLQKKQDSILHILELARSHGISRYPPLVTANKQWRKALRRNPPCRQFPCSLPRLCCGVIEKVSDLDGVTVNLRHICFADDEWGRESKDEGIEGVKGNEGAAVCNTCKTRHISQMEQQVDVRIAGVDGIERGQHHRFWEAALAAAATMFPKDTKVALETLGDDQYGRVVAKVYAVTTEGRRRDLGKWLVQQGIAYVSLNFSQGEEYDRAEVKAKEAAEILRGAVEGVDGKEQLTWAASNGMCNIHIVPNWEKPWTYKSRIRQEKMRTHRRELDARDKGKRVIE